MNLPSITPIYRWAGVAVLTAACLWICIDARSCYGQHQVTDHVQQADQHHEQATNAAAQGAAHDQDADQHLAQLQDDATEVARLRAEVARLRQAPAPKPAPPASPLSPAPEPVVPGVDLAALVAKQNELISAQGRQITDLQTQTLVLTRARDAWRQSAQDSAQEAVQLRSALTAQQGVAKAQRWLGRIEGFAVGAALAYPAGRLH